MLDPWLQFTISLAIAVVVAVGVTGAAALTLRIVARRLRWPNDLIRRARRSFRVVVLVISLWSAFSVTFPATADQGWRETADRLFTIALIAGGGWLAAGLLAFATDILLGRNRIDVPDNRVARRNRTQTLILRRLGLAVIAVIAVGAILLTFPAVRTVGASLLASAGILSVVAGLAAQSVLANMFAGLQLVFSEALRVDDVVVVEDEWGRIGEITLSYVVVDLWDDRRLVLPCTYFTTKPFQNWTRQGSELLGAVEIDVDWRVSPALMRERLDEILQQTDLWDGRASVLQVTEATGGMVRIRILVTAVDAPILFDLRCYVREAMVTWVQRTMPDALPVQRVMLTEPTAPSTDATQLEDARDAQRSDDETATAGLFTGSQRAEQRASAFTNAIPVVGQDTDR